MPAHQTGMQFFVIREAYAPLIHSFPKGLPDGSFVPVHFAPCRITKQTAAQRNRMFCFILTDCRMHYATKLLAERSDMSIAEIAQASGFPSADTFGRNFRQKYALTPSQYRKQQG